jgi:hypothetical protein
MIRVDSVQVLPVFSHTHRGEFFLFRHYLSKPIATIGNFEEIVVIIDHQQIYIGFQFCILLVNAIIFYVFPYNLSVIYGSYFSICVLLFYII